MERYNNKLLPHLIELQNEIQTNPNELTFNAIYQTKEWLHSITLQLNNVHNSKLPINKAFPDILYNIFSLAIYDSTHPGNTVLAISYVCRHWRKSVLDWPALWAFIDLNYSGSTVDLFVNRSKDTPLTLSWTWPVSNISSSKSYLESHANLMLPRLCSLTLQIPNTLFVEIQHVFSNTQLSPLQLRHLDIMIQRESWSAKVAPLTDVFRIDMSYLQRLRLEKVDLPWLVLPENKLTHFTFMYPTNLPPLSQILAILSYCPHLCELKFGIGGGAVEDPEDLMTSLASKLDLPQLKTLVLELKDPEMAEFEYLEWFSACIQTSGSLSRFKLSYDDLWHPSDLLSFNIFGPVPSGTFSHFAGFHYLFISLELLDTDSSPFRIVSAPEYTDTLDLSSYPLYLSGSCPRRTSFDNSPILNLIHSLPEITRLTLCYQSWETLHSWNIDIHRVFPCLDTLELRDLGCDSANQLISFCVGLKLKTLILEGIDGMSVETLLVISLKTGIEVLELDKQNYQNAAFQEAISALRQSGVTVVPFDYRGYDC